MTSLTRPWPEVYLREETTKSCWILPKKLPNVIDNLEKQATVVALHEGRLDFTHAYQGG